MARVAVGGFQHETNTFAPGRAGFAAFERHDGCSCKAHPAVYTSPAKIMAPHAFPGAGAARRCAAPPVAAREAKGMDQPAPAARRATGRHRARSRTGS